ncbi:hypothetical protein CGRA01v4_13031 [Colletotrichum graminicola]|nr:hypothetical protein CGRA01v4_13031 [Colletotrichum graminicola]
MERLGFLFPSPLPCPKYCVMSRFLSPVPRAGGRAQPAAVSSSVLQVGIRSRPLHACIRQSRPQL